MRAVRNFEQDAGRPHFLKANAVVIPHLPEKGASPLPTNDWQLGVLTATGRRLRSAGQHQWRNTNITVAGLSGRVILGRGSQRCSDDQHAQFNTPERAGLRQQLRSRAGITCAAVRTTVDRRSCGPF
jgi:hypothetical protein